MPATILVVDDDEKITTFLYRILTYEGYEVYVAHDGIEGFNKTLEVKPDLVILDILMPGIDGIEVCKRLRKQNVTTPFLMLTAKDEVTDRVQGLDAGADDYLVKPFALEELLARVRALLRRRQREEKGDKNTLKFADLTLNTATREVFRGKRRLTLTTKEFELLKLFLENPRQVLSKELIMEKIWGFDYSGESNVLEVYIRMLRQKLEEGDNSRLIHTVRGVGYTLKEEV
ncbi:MAG: two-component system, OmpR family, response regulator MprA [Clostridia bacterium]|jgi:two-component system response regulator MprA|nr:DNA-binding response regulator [Clostridiales bacterium]MDK2985458.1 two-component system, OmpR family, response regulator MprA [Clostridia bacterium]